MFKNKTENLNKKSTLRQLLFPLFFSVLLFLNPLRADIIQCHDINDLIKYSNHDTLIVIGIDNVLMRTAQELGSVRWASYEINEEVKKGVSKEIAIARFVPLWHKILIVSSMVPVQQTTAGIMRKLQKNGMPMIGLSSRYIEMAYQTHQQLRSMFIHLERGALYPEDIELFAPFPAKYIEGILFCGLKNDKGTTLLNFQNLIKYTPARIVFIDDDLMNLKNIEKAVENRGISFIGLHYTYVKETLPPLDISVPRKQLEIFLRILEDEEALQLIEATP